VYAALGETVPAPLNTYLHCVAAPRLGYAAAVQEATLGDADVEVIAAVALMRGIDIDG
jgi:hypothetical protein